MPGCMRRGAPVRKPARGILQKHSHECSSDSLRLHCRTNTADLHGQGESTLSTLMCNFNNTHT